MAEPRSIIHVDMDAFFASVEQLDNPSLRGKPVLVGGDPASRGVVSAASYEARPFGVHSAMPMAQAIRLCPHAVVMPVRFSRYIELSDRIQAILLRYTPLVEPVSIDEAFLDVTGSEKLKGPAETIGHSIKKNIRDETGLTASVGIAPNKFLAKLASDLRKPDGLVVMTEDNKQAILDPLPITRLWGVGKTTGKLLADHGIETVGQFRSQSPAFLEKILGRYALELLDLARGIDDRPVETESEAKSLSAETTFPDDVADRRFLLDVLLDQADQVSHRLRKMHKLAKTVTLKIRDARFRTVTRSRGLPEPTDVTDTFRHTAESVFTEWFRPAAGPWRLIGFRLSSLSDSDRVQLSLFPDPDQQKQKKIDETLDAIRDRFGRDSLKRGPGLRD
jgi:DNA polymerase IV